MQHVLQTVQSFLTFLVPVACLALVYFLGRIKPIGRFYAVLLIPPGKLFFALSVILSPFDLKQKKSESKYPGLRTIVLLIALGFAVVALASDGYNTLQALPAIWPDANFTPPSLPAFFTYSMGWLFLSLPALTGMIWLEQKVELEVQIFTVPQAFQKQFERFIFLTFVLSFLASLAFNALKPSFTADNTSVVTQSLQICVFVLMGGLLPLVMALTVYILALGLQAVASLILTIAWFLTSLLADLIDFLVLDFTGNEWSIKDTHKGVRVIDRSSTVTIVPEHHAHSFLRDPAEASDAKTEGVVPIETQEVEKIPMGHPDKNAAIVFVGQFGSRMFPLIAQAVARLRATESILSSAWLDLAIALMQTTLPGIVDLSPTAAVRNTAMVHGESERQAYSTLLSHLVDRLVEIHQQTKGSPAPLFFVLDCRMLLYAVEMLESIKRRLPLHSLVVITSLSALDAQNKSVQTGIADMQSLVAEDIIETVMVVDPHSPFAHKFGENTQLHFLAQALISLVIAHKHSLHNRSCTNVFQELHHLSPFTTLSFASEAVALGKVPNRWAFVPFVKNHTGTGNYSDVLSQTRAGIHRVVTEETTRAFPAAVHTDSSCILLCSSPYELNNRRFADSLRDNSQHVSTHYPFASSLTVRGNGCPYPNHMGSKYLVTATLLYALHPASLAKLQAGKQQTITSVFPVPDATAPTNGKVNTPTEPAGEAKHTPVASSQPKIAAPINRRGRKNTKAGK